MSELATLAQSFQCKQLRKYIKDVLKIPKPGRAKKEIIATMEASGQADKILRQLKKVRAKEQGLSSVQSSVQSSPNKMLTFTSTTDTTPVSSKSNKSSTMNDKNGKRKKNDDIDKDVNSEDVNDELDERLILRGLTTNGDFKRKVRRLLKSLDEEDEAA